ncbi:MAG: S8 family peptidase [Clostridia bacterium]|nr:S8 family peptidase [Clostridia bacterium]
MRFKKLLALTLALIVGIIPVSTMAADDSSSISQNKRVVVVSKKANKKDTDASLNKYKHKKVKSLTNFKGAEVVLVDDAELAKLKADNTIQVFEDAAIKISKPKESKKNKVQQIPWGVKRVGAETAWSKTTGKGIKVADIDSGIAPHKDLRKNIKGEFNAIEPGKPTTDDYGHGTHVAGKIAAKDNKVGVVGVAPDAELYAVKVLDAFGSGYLSDLVEGIDWSINNGIQVVNLSVEVQSDYPLLKDSIRRALDAGLIVVAAAGNTNGGSVAYPAAYDGVISVSAIHETDKIADFSAVGKVDFCAPGTDIRSTYLGDGYANLSGTSMATPHVTGVLALMLADSRNDTDGNGLVSTNEVKNIILCYAEDIGKDGYDEIYGNGIIKASN